MRPKRLPASRVESTELLRAFGYRGERIESLRAALADAGEDTRLGYAFEIARRLAAEAVPSGYRMSDPREVKDYLRVTLGICETAQEETGAIYLTARNAVLRVERGIYRGTLDRAVVEPREILRRGLILQAASLILFHNHPSGDPTPSREDREFTRRLATACEAVGIRLLDHIVAASAGCVSFREAGLL